VQGVLRQLEDQRLGPRLKVDGPGSAAFGTARFLQDKEMSLRRSPRLNVVTPTTAELAAWARAITPLVLKALELPAYSAERVHAIVTAYEAVMEGHGIRFMASLDNLCEVLESRLWGIRLEAENLSVPLRRKLVSLYERFRVFLMRAQSDGKK
jgi:hypothetical protein